MVPRWSLCLVGVALWSGCPAEQKFPGDEVMGTFKLKAELLENGCPFPDIPDTWEDFFVTLSRNSPEEVYVTLGSASYPAQFDGQVVRARYSAPRQFVCPESAGGDGGLLPVEMAEVLEVALLSASQNAALGGACPDNPLTEPLPSDADAGVFPPLFTDRGFDALRACGTLTDQIDPPESACAPCQLRYRVTGERR